MAIEVVPFVNYATAFHVTAVADLRLVVPPISKMGAILAGHTTSGDGGGGHFYWDASSTATDDDGTVLNPGLGSAPGRWLRIRTPGHYHASWWGCNATNADNSTALANAIAAMAVTGGTLQLPSGVLQYSTTLNLNDSRHITIEGSSTYQENQSSKGTTLQYTGSGASAVTAASAAGLALKKIAFYPSPSFGGVILSFGHSLVGNDPYGIVIEECNFQGGYVTFGGSVKTIGVWMANIIGAQIRDCWFIDLYYSILGQSTNSVTPQSPGNASYSDQVYIETCQFGFGPIYNPGIMWTIDGCSFEGVSSWGTGTANAYALGCDPNGTGGGTSYGLTLRSNVFGDGNIDVWCYIGYAQGLTVEGNFWGAAGNKALVLGGVQLAVNKNNFSGLITDFPLSANIVVFIDNKGLNITNGANAYIGVSGRQNVLIGNSGGGGYQPPTIISSDTQCLFSGVQVDENSTTIKQHYSETSTSVTWSPSTVPNDGVSLAVISFPQARPGQTVTVAFTDPALPDGVLLFGNVNQGGLVRVQMFNKSGSSYTPAAGTLRVDLWVH